MKTFDIEQTQEIGSMAQDFDLSPLSSVNSTGSLSQSLNGANWSLPSSRAVVCSVSSAESSRRGGNDTQMLQDMMIRNATTADDTDMLGELIPFGLGRSVL